LKVHRYFFNRGSKSRNKVAVGEPAAGSFSDDQNNKTQPSFGVSLFRGAAFELNTPSNYILPLEPAVCDNKTRPALGARLSQRVAMDDLASYFVEERSKVR
jgi:hypothetical protein